MQQEKIYQNITKLGCHWIKWNKKDNILGSFNMIVIQLHRIWKMENKRLVIYQKKIIQILFMILFTIQKNSFDKKLKKIKY